jgi:hypothetical protein
MHVSFISWLIEEASANTHIEQIDIARIFIF